MTGQGDVVTRVDNGRNGEVGDLCRAADSKRKSQAEEKDYNVSMYNFECRLGWKHPKVKERGGIRREWQHLSK